MDKDPYRYFRIEARELLDGLHRGALDLDKEGAVSESLACLLRLAHTLKGAARVVKQGPIADLAHAVEGALAPHRESRSPLSQKDVAQLFLLLDAISEKVSALDGPAVAPGDVVPAPAAEEPLRTLRIEVRDLDALLQGVCEAGSQLTALRRRLSSLEQTRRLADAWIDAPGHTRTASIDGAPAAAQRARAAVDELLATLDRVGRDMTAGLDRLGGEMEQAGDRARRMRLLPASDVFATLERAARDTAQVLGKRVVFEAAGGDVRLDAHVLAGIRDALLHVVRNAIAHGIEDEPARAAAGKPPAGHVQIHVEKRGGRVAFACRDDGCGIDTEAVRRAAVRLGVVSGPQAASLGVDDALRLILQAGVTTAGAVSQVSGRGIGLDVLRETAARLRGEVRVRSERGRGTTVEVQVPVSLSSRAVLIVQAGGISACLPLDAVRSTHRAGETDSGGPCGESWICDGTAVPLLPLARALKGARSPARDGPAAFVVVIESGRSRVALGVDALLGMMDLVVRPLSAWIAADPIVAEASLDGEGNPLLVLDPAGLVRAAVDREAAAEPAAAALARPPVLVVDDSLTTRMLEQSILESAGYEVDLATSAEEALRKAHDRRYGLFLVDVEMPEMDGFELVERTRSDPALREIPSIMVTSRSSPDDRRRGEKVGARDYVVKSEFDQARLLRTIRGLIG